MGSEGKLLFGKDVVRNKEIIERYNKGEPVKTIAEDYGITEGTISKLIKRAGWPNRDVRRQQRDEIIVKKYREGEAADALAKEFGISRGQIYNIVKKAGAGRTRRREVSEAKAAEIVRIYQLGYTTTDVARAFGVSYSRARSILLARGVMRPRGTPIQSRKIRTITEKEAVYLAGLIDGEGNLEWHYKQGPRGQRWISPRLTISNTSKAMMVWLEDLGIKPMWQKRDGNRDIARWEVSRVMDFIYLMQRVIPYLTAKKEKARNMLKEVENRWGPLILREDVDHKCLPLPLY